MTNNTDESQRDDAQSRLAADFIIPLLACGLAGYYLATTTDLVWEARAAGVAVGVPLDRACASSTWGARSTASSKAAAASASATSSPTRLFNRQRLALGLLIAAFIIALPWTGTTLGLFLVLIASMRMLGVTSIRTLAGRRRDDRRDGLCAADLPGEQPAAAGPDRMADRLGVRNRGLTVDVSYTASLRIVRTLAGAVVDHPAGHAARHDRRHPAGLQRAEHADHPAAAHALYEHRGRHGLDDLALLHDAARRRHPGDPLQHARRRRRRRDRA